MADQDSSLITAPAAVETSEGPSPEWLAVHRTTAEELATAQWVEGRSQDVAANRILRQEMGQSYEAYKEQLDGLSTKERMALIDSSAEEIVADLDHRSLVERERKNQAEQAEKQAREQAEAQFGETPGLRQVRHAVQASYRESTLIDKTIEKFKKLNELREDPGAKGWDDQPAELWRKAREGTLESYDPQISNLVQEKQARLQEAAFHQTAYHEGARAQQPGYAPPATAGSPANMPVGQVIGNDGQPMVINRSDIAQIEQMARDQQNYEQRANETAKRYPDWDEAFALAGRTDGGLTPGQVQFITILPNGPEVGYHLAKHHDDRRAIGRMSSHESERALIYISHQLASNSAPAERRTTQAPKPPSPVGGGSSRVWSPYDESGSNEEWAHRRYQDLKRRGKAS